MSGSCPYGKRCCFIHTELPASGAPPGADGTPPPTMSDHGRSRSASTNSDPAESSSLLARINAKRHSAAGTPIQQQQQQDVTPTASTFGRPGGLRVDTSTLSGASAPKENKSAYPAFSQNGMRHAAPEQPSALSPIAVTAHPDFGGRNGSRMDLSAQPQVCHPSLSSLRLLDANRVSFRQSRLSKTVASPNNRHSFNGTDMNLDFSSPPAGLGQLGAGMPAPGAAASLGRAGGHVRSGSAGNWSQLGRTGRLAVPAGYSPIPGSDLKSSSPWGASELVGSARLS